MSSQDHGYRVPAEISFQKFLFYRPVPLGPRARPRQAHRLDLARVRYIFSVFLDHFFRFFEHLTGQRAATAYFRTDRMRRRYIFRLTALFMLAVLITLGFGHGLVSR